MTIVDNAVYVDGRRIRNPDSLEDTFELMRDERGMAWIGLYRPSREEVEAVAEEFGLHPLAVEDALSGHQRAKLERYDDGLFVVLRPARYADAAEAVVFGELHVFVGPDFVVTIRHADSPDLARVRRRLEEDPALLARGPEAVLYAILDQVVDEYAPVVFGVQGDVDEIEDQLFGDDSEDGLSERIYRLSREVIHFQRSVQPLTALVHELLQESAPAEGEPAPSPERIELRRSLRDVLDHTIRVTEAVDSLRAILDKALTVHSTLVSRRQTEAGLAQNDVVRRISSWAAILFAPTLVAGIYGMNFDDMPELHWRLGYPWALGLMVLFGFALYAVFKRKKWL
ncbi:magnesium and cobalt transport protein CorA [Rathayibacter tritici]|uniref:Magnesium transport protein CorA n=1 Tax=Rathayibacter tritici TaxID=33888 RepID=A0A160KT79_9MICO|nr:magnesium/cobalt transporter CorA [Rathayibacter tritici]AND17002.1 transporter [Rathayibacter tritici]PPF25495.1 magnesium and cobalt transport protein CorA [Rathayibacter tritici]PPF63853.1 magnesium and cobalt transport protein CorA [Rathayibacter tritici]PPG04378.1 magnesium and cobalt transport protein CorA [Rathayibacter tritici]PPI14750.1 magnesium and cobalt transport protein CorA [Rathayibacter tritici]